MSLKDIFNIEGKTILITGAAGFFGRYMTRVFLDVGANVVLFSKSRELSKLFESYKENYHHSNISSYLVDNREDDFRKYLKDAKGKHEINCLINNAYDVSPNTGFNCIEGCLELMTEEQWYSSFDCTFWAVLATQIIGESMKRRGGSIINIASMYSLISPRPELYEGTNTFNPPTYSTNKAAICGFTRYVASFWGRYNIRCNAILPGAFPNTESEGPNAVNKEGKFLKRLEKENRTALRRLGRPEELSGLLIFLACDASSYVTGQSIVIDGGWTIQ